MQSLFVRLFVCLSGPDAEPDLQILAQLNIGDEGRDGPDVKEAVL